MGDPTDNKVMRKSLIGKADQDSKGSPRSAQAFAPKPKSVCLLFAILYFFDINGGLSLTTFLWKINLELQLISSVQFGRSIMSDSLRPHESQHARPPCPSPTPGVHSDSRPSSL